MFPSNTPSSTSHLHSNLWFFLWIPLITSSLSQQLTSAEPNNNIIMLPTSSDYLPAPKSCPVPDPDLNFRPVIGIVSHPGDGASGRLKNGTNVSYIAASYVKFVESAGARVIPLVYTDPIDVIFKVSRYYGTWLRLCSPHLLILSYFE